MTWPALIVEVRHAESVGNTMTVDERAAYEVSSHDYALTMLGRNQATVTGMYLKERYGEFDAHFTSHYRRAYETGRLLYPEAKWIEDARLSESQRGVQHMLTRKQQKELIPLEIKRRKLEGNYHFRPLGGENWPDVELRVHSFHQSLRWDYAGKKVLVVIHGNWRINQMRVLHNISVEEAMERYNSAPIENASVTAYCGRGPYNERLVHDVENFVPWEGKLPKPKRNRAA